MAINRNQSEVEKAHQGECASRLSAASAKPAHSAIQSFNFNFKCLCGEEPKDEPAMIEHLTKALEAQPAAERTALKGIIAKIDQRLTELSYMTTGAYMTPDASEQFTWLSELKNTIKLVDAQEKARAKA